MRHAVVDIMLSSPAEAVKLYADIFFIINFSMDLMVFTLVAIVMKLDKRPLAFLMASCFTSAFQISRVYLPGSQVIGFLLWLTVVTVSCTTAFPKLKKRRFLLAFSLFMIFSGLLSILLMLLFRTIGTPELPEAMGKGSGGVIPLCICLFSAFAAKMLKKPLSLLLKKIGKGKKLLTATLAVTSNGQTLVLSAYKDSGNLLREPIGGLPVIIVGRENMEKIVPNGLRSVFFSEKDSSHVSLSDAKRVRIIPIMPVGSGGAQILFGYVPDKITIDGKEVGACIALDKGNARFGGCDALLPNCLG